MRGGRGRGVGMRVGCVKIGRWVVLLVEDV